MELLETLRYLNKDNINKEPKIRDELFKKLMICDENVSDYVPTLSDAYYEGFRKQYEGNIAINYLLSEIFCNEIKRQLSNNYTMDINQNEIIIKADKPPVIRATNSAEAVTYVGSVKGMKKIIEQAPQHFDFFKENLLMGLITRYCNETIRRRNNKKTLNEAVVTYAQHIRHLSPSNNIDMIIDEEFIDELKKIPYVDSKSCWLAVHRLIDRVYPRKIERSYYQDEFDDKGYKNQNKRR